MPSFSDRLADAVRRKGPLCVGLDPRWDMLPRQFQLVPSGDPSTCLQQCAEQFTTFCLEVLQLVEPHCGAIKVQAAFFELLGPPGMASLAAVLQLARGMGYVTILDAKRGDIASTATAYADAAFGGCTIAGTTIPIWNADALTINPYLGQDAIEPFLAAAAAASRGIFVLVRTSNPGAVLFQNLDCDGEPLYWHVANNVAAWNEPTIGSCGLGDVGAVVGATQPRELAKLRSQLPAVWFLVPGYGAQGGSASDVRAAYRADGLGAIVNSSRGVVFPFKPDDADWKEKIVGAAREARRELTK